MTQWHPIIGTPWLVPDPKKVSLTLPFGALFVPFGALFVPFGALLVPFGALLVPFGALLVPSRCDVGLTEGFFFQGRYFTDPPLMSTALKLRFHECRDHVG